MWCGRGSVRGGREVEKEEKRETRTHFSLAILSLLMRSRASFILEMTYCVTTYPAPTMPKPTAMGVRFRRNQRRVAANIAGGLTPNPISSQAGQSLKIRREVDAQSIKNKERKGREKKGKRVCSKNRWWDEKKKRAKVYDYLVAPGGGEEWFLCSLASLVRLMGRRACLLRSGLARTSAQRVTVDRWVRQTVAGVSAVFSGLQHRHPQLMGRMKLGQ